MATCSVASILFGELLDSKLLIRLSTISLLFLSILVAKNTFPEPPSPRSLEKEY